MMISIRRDSPFFLLKTSRYVHSLRFDFYFLHAEKKLIFKRK